MKIYLAGPMRGYDNFNFAAFDSAAANLRALGHTVFSPADNDRAKGYVGKPIDDIKRDCIMDDLTYIAREAEGIALLPKWQASMGVAVEVALAKFLNLKIIELTEREVYGLPCV
jgi:nucleoside 2-deoxyribosyltransferase